MILNETDSMNPLFQSAAAKHLLSKTPRFTPTATQVDVDSVKLDSYRTVLRLQKTYVRSVCKEMFNHKDQNAQAAGIVNWKRLTFSRRDSYKRKQADFGHVTVMIKVLLTMSCKVDA